MAAGRSAGLRRTRRTNAESRSRMAAFLSFCSGDGFDVERARTALVALGRLVEQVTAPVRDPALVAGDDAWIGEPGGDQHGREADPVPHPLVGLTTFARVTQHEVLQMPASPPLDGGAV